MREERTRVRAPVGQRLERARDRVYQKLKRQRRNRRRGRARQPRRSRRSVSYGVRPELGKRRDRIYCKSAIEIGVRQFLKAIVANRRSCCSHKTTHVREPGASRPIERELTINVTYRSKRKRELSNGQVPRSRRQLRERKKDRSDHVEGHAIGRIRGVSCRRKISGAAH